MNYSHTHVSERNYLERPISLLYIIPEKSPKLPRFFFWYARNLTKT
jgi:hypothetical protein